MSIYLFDIQYIYITIHHFIKILRYLQLFFRYRVESACSAYR